MRIQKQLVVIFFLCLLTTKLYAQIVAIIPQPQEVNLKEGSFSLGLGISVQVNNEESKTIALIFSQALLKLGIQTPSSFSNVHLQLLQQKNEKLKEEGYYLKIQSDHISISANTHAGLFYGTQSLLQLIETAENGFIPCMDIVDYPAYVYRGLHLDVARHFFSKEFIKKYIDQMAFYKLNTFHWHLTDDQGWRIEIKRYPKLTEIGAWRKEKDGSLYGGYYSQEDIKEIVQYAKERYVTIIPEIDMPGHFSAAIAAYPQLGCDTKAIPVPTNYGVKKNVFCPSSFSFQFIQDVIVEACELFPGPYIHIGGDEVLKRQWKKNKAVQQLMQEENIKNEQEIEYYISEKVAGYVKDNGKQCLAWGELVKAGLPDHIHIMSWRGKRAGVKAAKQAHNVVMSPRTYCYFDYPQKLAGPYHAVWMTYLPLRKVYSYSPVSFRLLPNEKRYILGGEAMLWTEFVSTEEKAMYQVFPRITAFAESLWTMAEKKDYRSFKIRLKEVLQ